MNIGDKVFYVPHECHARHRNSDGTYAWVIGRRVKRRDEEFVEELPDAKIEEFLQQIRQNPSLKQTLVFVRPSANCWLGIVHDIYDDGTVDLDVDCGGNGVTLHVEGLNVGKHPHCAMKRDTEPTALELHRYSKIQRRGAHERRSNAVQASA